MMKYLLLVIFIIWNLGDTIKNYFIYLLKSKIDIKIYGKNIERFIKRLKSNNIDILRLNHISNEEIVIRIYKEDYDKVLNIKTVYDIKILDYFGIERYKINILSNKYVIISILISLIFLYISSNLIFHIDIVTNDTNIKKILYVELKEFGIEKYKFKKNYEKLQYIKKQILKKYQDKIEWIEIENIGTKYIIRYEPRIINKEKEQFELRNIVAKKDAVIKSLNISSGQVVKNINSYVKKGDIIVSGYIKLNENIKDTVSSNGKVYGETWYNVTIDYPYKYFEEYKTGKQKKVFVFKFLTTNIELLNFNKYKTKRVKEKTLLKNNILPIKFEIQKQYETKIYKENNTEDELIKKALKYSEEKIKNTLDENEYISNYKILNKIKKQDSIELNIFYSVVEDITEYQSIEEYSEEIN